MNELKRLKVTVLDFDDEGINSLIEELSAQIDFDIDLDLPLDFNEERNRLKYCKLIVDLVKDPFSIDLYLNHGINKSEIWVRSQVVYNLLERWLSDVGYSGGGNTLMDVRLVGYRIYIMGVANERKRLRNNRLYQQRHVQV